MSPGDEISRYSDWVSASVDDACSLDFTDTILRPSSDLGDGPALYLNVPRASVPAWLDRVRGWIGEAMAADAFRIAEVDRPDTTNVRALRRTSTSEASG